jgi:hypothetical protein
MEKADSPPVATVTELSSEKAAEPGGTALEN